MIYEKTITTPANTTSSSPQVTALQIERGIIQELFIVFPPGPSGLLHLQIKYHESIIFPKTLGDFRGDNLPLLFHNVGYPCYTEPLELALVTWNDDDTFEHDVDVYFNITRLGIIL